MALVMKTAAQRVSEADGPHLQQASWGGRRECQDGAPISGAAGRLSGSRVKTNPSAHFSLTLHSVHVQNCLREGQKHLSAVFRAASQSRTVGKVSPREEGVSDRK